MPKTRNWHWYIEKQTEFEAHMHAISDTVYQGRTPFQGVGIVRSECYGKVLILDGDTQSAQLDEFIYHEALIHPALILHQRPRRVLILGGGEGATLREALRHRTVEEAVMVDIDGAVVDLCKVHLPEWSAGAYDDPRSTIVIGDARAYVEAAGPPFDVIISDLTEPLADSPSHQLFSTEFFGLLKRRLAPDGVLAVQASTADLHCVDMHTLIARTLATRFRHVRPYHTRIPSFDSDWAFCLASETLDPLALNEEEVDRRIQQRVQDRLRFYDGETHRMLFALPKWYREALAAQTAVIEDRQAPAVAQEAGEMF